MSAAHNLTAEDFAFSRLISYAAYQWPGYKDAAHHRLIARHLEMVERGEITRLMITMPPRHGKSMLASEFFPAWYMGRNPDHYVVTATYAQELADDFGRKVKNQIEDAAFQAIFPGVGLADDSKSAKRFHIEGNNGGFEHETTQRGAFYAVGIGGPLTGRGAHLLLIDDPVKNREDADSEVMRKKTMDWYTSTAYTRLMPGGRIVVIQCMTGDTPVLMADGTEKPLRDVRAGDSVATYKGGGVAAAKVLNWASQGHDSVYEIKMTSGITVRANERHPFLVDRDGVAEWTRLKNIRAKDRILRVIGGNGAASPAPKRGVKPPHEARGCATSITGANDGPKGIGQHPPKGVQDKTSNFVTGTASELMSMTPCSNLRMGFAPFASDLHPKDRPSIGEEHSASITTMRQVPSGGCCATTATSLLAGGVVLKSFQGPLSILSVTSDEVLSILPCGSDEVFDIQVEGTENFIANGLVSHNTRWHESDLSGWLQDEHAHEGWVLLNLPAIGDDGKALWPEQYDIEALERIKRALPGRDWSALYQQQPQPDEGTFFKREWLTEWTTKPAHLSIYGTSDYAVTDGGGDYTVHRIWGVDHEGVLYRLAGWRGQTSSDVWIEEQLDLAERWKPLAWFGEAGVIAKAIEPMLIRRMRERPKAWCRMEWLPSIHDKATRARGFQARAAMGSVRFEPGADLGEFLSFPAGKHDDDVDTASMIGRALDQAHPAIIPVTARQTTPTDYRPPVNEHADGSAWG